MVIMTDVSDPKPRTEKHQFDSFFVEAMLECLEVEDAFLYVLIPLILVVCLGFLGVMAYHWGLDPYSADALSRMDVLSIDPDKWSPRG
jgi:hypothetical protein